MLFHCQEAHKCIRESNCNCIVEGSITRILKLPLFFDIRFSVYKEENVRLPFCDMAVRHVGCLVVGIGVVGSMLGLVVGVAVVGCDVVGTIKPSSGY
jgi:hypothetical protein